MVVFFGGETGDEGVEGGADVLIVVAEFVDGAVGVEDGGVVASAEMAADFFEAVIGQVAGQIHADLTGEGDAS